MTRLVAEIHTPAYAAAAPFIALLLAIALLPLLKYTRHWWERNASKLLVSLALAAITIVYYLLRGYGVAHGEQTTGPGLRTVGQVLGHAVLGDYIPFIVLLLSLYTVCGGIVVRGNL